MGLETAEAMGEKVQEILNGMKDSFSWQSIVYLGLFAFVMVLLLHILPMEWSRYRIVRRPVSCRAQSSLSAGDRCSSPEQSR